MVEGFLVGTITEIVAESCIEFLKMGFRIGIDLLGCGFQRFEVRRWVAITEGVVRDDGEAGFQKGLEFGVHLSLFLTAETQRSQRDAEENLKFRS